MNYLLIAETIIELSNSNSKIKYDALSDDPMQRKPDLTSLSKNKQSRY